MKTLIERAQEMINEGDTIACEAYNLGRALGGKEGYQRALDDIIKFIELLRYFPKDSKHSGAGRYEVVDFDPLILKIHQLKGAK